MENLTKKDIRELLSIQTKEVKQMVEGMLITQTKEVKGLLAEQTVVILSAVDEKILALDLKFTQKIDELTTTLNHFLKRMTDMEEEFTFMKNDLKRMKKIMKEKLGVEI